jgi:GT2 family glycosyltransferase
LAEVAVVILNWNGADLLRQFLPYLIRYTDPELAGIWVADNGSTDASLEVLAGEFSSVQVLELGENFGFAEGYNRALNRIEAEYFVLLNSDVEVSENWLEPMYTALKENASLGVCCPKIRSWHKREEFEHAGAAGGFLDKYGYPFCRGRIFNVLEKDVGQFDDNCEIFWASGACFMIRSELYRRAGGLDPYFFAHMEEIDLCWRIKNMGYRVQFCYESTIFHIGGATLPKNNNRKTYLNFRNNIILLYKNLPSRRLYRVLFPRLILDCISLFQFLARLEFRNFYAVIRAHISLMGHLSSIRDLRRRTLGICEPSLHPELFGKSIVYNFFIKGRKYFRELEF